MTLSPAKRKNGTVSTPNLPQLLTSRETAAILNCDPVTLRASRMRGTGPYSKLPWIKISPDKGGKVFYEMSEVLRWIDERRCRHQPSEPETTAAE